MVRNHAEFDKDLLWAKSNVLDFAMKAGGFGLPISSNPTPHTLHPKSHTLHPTSYTRVSDLISRKVFMQSFCKSQFPHKSGNLSFTITDTNKLTDLCGN